LSEQARLRANHIGNVTIVDRAIGDRVQDRAIRSRCSTTGDSGTAEHIAISGWFAPCRAPDARVALRQPAGDARRDRGGSLDVQEVTEVRHDLEDTRVEQPTVLVGRRHDAAVVAAMEL
jgi:CO/xanthine dehydrogenase FAD-binding subunit